jgi:hypothetical protein
MAVLQVTMNMRLEHLVRSHGMITHQAFPSPSLPRGFLELRSFSAETGKIFGKLE